MMPMMAPIIYDESQLIPTLPYYDLPAGLMVPLVPLEDVGYKPIDPKKIRLPPPTPPTASLLAALEQFYAPPSHERPRDPDGWELLGFYEWSKNKTAAVKAKADAIEAGDRERSPTASPEHYYSEGSTPERKTTISKPSLDDQKPVEVKRKRYTSRSRSRTRSRSRESTPEFSSSRKRRDSRSPPRGRRQRSESRSPSPTGSYSIPSYLTKSRKSPEPRRESSLSPPPTTGVKNRRSPSPENLSGLGSEYLGFGAMKKLDSSNKGHQMMQKMGWKGSGLGSGESGIVDPIEVTLVNVLLLIIYVEGKVLH
jgi:calcium homeostasis ER protein